MEICLGLIGANGKMGTRIASLAKEDNAFTLGFSLSSQNHREDLPLVDVIIDFSTKEALLDNLKLALKQKKPIVIGTTGLDAKDQETLSLAADKIPIFFAPNFSPGFAALLYLTKKMSTLLQEYKPHIQEIHHIHKKDSPSGSSLALQKALKEHTEIKSLREGEVIGIHSVSFTGELEKCTLSHEVFSRDVFAKGALKAAKFIISQPAGLYGMSDLLAMLDKN